MADMTPERWQWLGDYAHELFGDPDDQLATLMERAVEAGLPSIAVSADVGRLLNILASSTPGRVALELGTLGGYSGIWIARGLAPQGRLVTIEANPDHADFAEWLMKHGIDSLSLNPDTVLDTWIRLGR